MKKPRRVFQPKRKHRINEELIFPEVRIVGRGEPYVCKTSEAIELAQSEDKDLILINESQTPPIARIEDYNKFLYNTEKLEKEKKKAANKSQLKEIQLSVNISDHDLEVKAKRGRDFLKDGDKIKVVMSLKGRERANPTRGEVVMLKFAQAVEEFGIPENLPKLESSKWLMFIKTKKK